MKIKNSVYSKLMFLPKVECVRISKDAKQCMKYPISYPNDLYDTLSCYDPVNYDAN